SVRSLLSSPFFFFSSRRRHTRFSRDWSSDVCSSDLGLIVSERLSAELSPVLGRARQAHQEGRDLGGLLSERPELADVDIPSLMEIGRASCRERVDSVGGAGELHYRDLLYLESVSMRG